MQQSHKKQGNTTSPVILWGTGFMAAVVSPEFFLALYGVEQDHIYYGTTCNGIANNSFCKCSKVHML